MLKLKLKLAMSLIIVVLLIIFTLQNTTKVTVRFIIGGPVVVPLAYLLYASVLFGMMLVGIAFLTRTFRLRNLQKQVLAQQDALRQISQNLIMAQQVGIPSAPQLASLPQYQNQTQSASVEKPIRKTPAQKVNNNRTSPSAQIGSKQ